MTSNLEDWFNIRLELEKRAVDQEKNKLFDLIRLDLLTQKQKLLSETWSKLQDFTSNDPKRFQILKKQFPLIINQISSKIPKKRTPKKIQLPKLSQNIVKLELTESKIINDLCGIPILKNNENFNIQENMIMLTQTGQKWLVKIKKLPNENYSITYCDGSVSRISLSDIKTLGITFLPNNQE